MAKATQLSWIRFDLLPDNFFVTEDIVKIEDVLDGNFMPMECTLIWLPMRRCYVGISLK